MPRALKPRLYMKRTGYCLKNLENDATTTIDFLLHRLFEQARQSNSKGGSPAEPLILNNLNDSGGLNHVKVFSWCSGEAIITSC